MIMHLFFLGVVKTVIKLVQFFLKCRLRKENFVRKVQGRLEDIAALKLMWCKAVPHKQGSFGGWVSENYVALGKLIKWFYSDITEIVETEEWVEPVGPQVKWTKKQNAGWLKMRGLDSKGTAAELSVRVNECMKAPDGPPPLTKDMEINEHDAARLTVALSAMLSRVMVSAVDPDTSPHDLEVSIKVSPIWKGSHPFGNFCHSFGCHASHIWAGCHPSGLSIAHSSDLLNGLQQH